MRPRAVVLIFPDRRVRRLRRSRPTALSAWRGPLTKPGSTLHAAVIAGLSPIHVLRVPQWRAAVQGDPAAAIGVAIAFAFSTRQTAQIRDLVMASLWWHACAGNRAAVMTLQMLLRERGRLRS
ncbi:hypothetical protein [Methylopila sp. Yamaguchi]|uniref:hypothetical protein n=1 Tax=Methylopila sp. Yamaguchi TaxID=1437817 RepID=UPI000CC2F120|nr:hypothetical protein [Methylopila sp. Yamaguchi]GBD46856.1 hypothetical protein METY_0069 [Methylopila sp. Yamaguchi]